MATTPKFTLEDYLAQENAGPVRHDYLAGLRYPRPLPGPMHRHLSETLGARLRAHLRHDASYVFTGGIRIRVPDFDAVYYADAAVAVDPHYEEGTFVRAPILAVDIFGRAPGPNRKRRLAHYLSLGTLRQYVLLAPHQPSAMVYGRDADEDDAWYQDAVGANELLHLTSVSLALPLMSLYEGAPDMQQAEPGGLGLPFESDDEG